MRILYWTLEQYVLAENAQYQESKQSTNFYIIRVQRHTHPFKYDHLFLFILLLSISSLVPVGQTYDVGCISYANLNNLSTDSTCTLGDVDFSSRRTGNSIIIQASANPTLKLLWQAQSQPQHAGLGQGSRNVFKPLFASSPLRDRPRTRHLSPYRSIYRTVNLPITGLH
jgi:hypothetical protein